MPIPRRESGILYAITRLPTSVRLNPFLMLESPSTHVLCDDRSIIDRHGRRETERLIREPTESISREQDTPGFYNPYPLSMQNNPIEVYTDGATLGWNGKLGTVSWIGVGVFVPEFNIRFSQKEPGLSNNVAEIRAVIRALEILPVRDRSVFIKADSRTVVGWVNKRKKSGLKLGHLRIEQEKLYPLIDRYPSVKAIWIPRELNFVADDLSTKCFR